MFHVQYPPVRQNSERAMICFGFFFGGEAGGDFRGDGSVFTCSSADTPFNHSSPSVAQGRGEQHGASERGSQAGTLLASKVTAEGGWAGWGGHMRCGVRSGESDFESG